MNKPAKGIWDERNKTWIKPSGTVQQGRRPMYRSNEQTLIQKAENYVNRNVKRFGKDVLSHSNVVKLVADLVAALKQSEHYTPQWREFVKNCARPGDVANIIIERDNLRKQRDELLAQLGAPGQASNVSTDAAKRKITT